MDIIVVGKFRQEKRVLPFFINQFIVYGITYWTPEYY